MNYWIYKNKKTEESFNIFDSSAFKRNNISCFIYKITNIDTERFYIGKKNVYSKIKKKIGKKELAGLNKNYLRSYKSKSGKTKGKIIYFKEHIEESNWLLYTGSNKILNDEIALGANIIKEILLPVVNKGDLTYFETKYLFAYNVLEREDCYNENILGSFYRKKRK